MHCVPLKTSKIAHKSKLYQTHTDCGHREPGHKKASGTEVTTALPSDSAH